MEAAATRAGSCRGRAECSSATGGEKALPRCAPGLLPTGLSPAAAAAGDCEAQQRCKLSAFELGSHNDRNSHIAGALPAGPEAKSYTLKIHNGVESGSTGMREA